MIEDFLIYIVPIAVSMILGSIIGWEREHEHKPAGLRTIVLVCLGATTFTLIASIVHLEQNPTAFGRILASIISGIGFLGASVVWKHEDSCEGITTASVLWAIVGVGMLVGLKEYPLAIIITFCILFILKLKHLKKD